MKNKRELIMMVAIVMLLVVAVASVMSRESYKRQYDNLLAKMGEASDAAKKIAESSGKKLRNEDKKDARNLMSRIKGMQRKINAKEDTLAGGTGSGGVEVGDRKVNVIRQGEGGALSHKERMAKMKEEQPEQYARMMDSYRKTTESFAKTLDGKEEFLKSLDTSLLDDKQIENHNKAIDKMRAMRELSEKILSNDGAEDINDLWERRMGLMREYHELMRNEKEAMVMSMASNLGYNKEEAVQFKDYLDYLDQVSSTPGFYSIPMDGVGQAGTMQSTISIMPAPR